MISSMDAKQTAAQKLAGFICDLDYRQIPNDAVARCRDLLLDQLGCQLIGATMEWNQPAYRFVKDNKNGGPARIVKHGDAVPLDDAVLVNGTFAQGCELDDYYDQGGGHPGAATVPVILALAQKQHVTGEELITAMVAGYEVGWRIGRALLPELMRRGYHAQSAGEVKRLHNGMACCGGLRSAMLAQIGLTGPPTIFEGERGILRVMSGGCNVEPIIAGLRAGSANLALYHAAMKRFPVNASQHSPIELLDHLVRTNKIAPEQVAKIEVGVNEGILLHGGTIYQPREVIEAQFSLRFSLALRLLTGNNDLPQYLDAAMWNDPAMLAIGQEIELIGDPTAVAERRFACEMKIHLTSGEKVFGSLAAPKGSYKNPLTQDELQEKFYRLGKYALGEAQLAAIVHGIDRIERAADVSSISSFMTMS